MAKEVELSKDDKDYKLLRLIGKGLKNSASIHLAKHDPTRSHVAVKIFHLELLDQENVDFGLVQHELLMGRQLQHESIVTAQCTFTAGQEIWSVMPIYGYGSCKDLLCAHFGLGLPEAAIAYILYDVIRALEYMHVRGIIHRSVKASHILISSDGRAYLSGLRHGYSMVEGGTLSSQVHEYPSHYLKTLLWAAPEVLQQNLCGYATSSDVYSLGITACELANANVPFADVDTTQMLLDKLNGVTPRLWDGTTLTQETLNEHQDLSTEDPMLPYMARQFTQHFHDFVETCLQFEPRSRPTCSELLHHSFFKSVRRKMSGVSPLPELLHPVQPVMEILKQLDSADKQSDDAGDLAAGLDNVTLDEGWDFD